MVVSLRHLVFGQNFYCIFGCLVNFIYMPVLSTKCVAVCAQESIPANTKHCNDVFGMSKMFMDDPRMLLQHCALAGMSIHCSAVIPRTDRPRKPV